jgi:hypothetical protein
VRNAAVGMLFPVRRTGARSRSGVKHPRIRRFARRIGADRNPLRRRVDKFEIAARFALVITFLVAAPLLAPVTGHAAAITGMRQVRQDRSWREVNAVLKVPAPQQFSGYGSLATFWVPARWTMPSGQVRSGQVPTKAGTRAGAKVSIWVTAAGAVTGRRPMTAGMVRVRTLLVQYLTVAGLGLTLLLFGFLLRVLLNRRRMSYWAMEWACFGPRWTTRRWPKT